ncbi:MAG: acyl-CoA dehydrogenase family protein, partial [Burkholderiales bacterium]
MEFGLSSEQVLLKDSLDAYLRERAGLDRVRRFAEKDEGRAVEVIAGLNEIGLSGLIIPTEYGGVGLGALEACVAAETLGYRITPVPFVANAIMVPTALMLAGSPAQQANWLPLIAAGKTVVGAALAERSGARALAGRQAGVTASDGRLSGRALYVLDFEADAYLMGDVAGGLHLVAADAP